MKIFVKISTICGAIIALSTVLGIVLTPFINNYIDNRIDKRAVSPEVITSIMTSPFMIDQKRIERNKILNDALHKSDSSKVKLSSNLVLKTGMNKEAMADTLASIIKNYCKNSGFVDNEQCIYNSKKYGRGRMSPATF